MSKTRIHKKQLKQVLKTINQGRNSLGLPPLDSIPFNGKCPIQTALQSTEVGTDYVKINRMEEAEKLSKSFKTSYNSHPESGFEVVLPKHMIQFIVQYDRGNIRHNDCLSG